jgi:hypothetical protein
MTLQQIFDTALPLLAALISYGLQQAHYSDKANTLIASVTILAAGGASVWISGQITPDILKDAGLIMAAATALQAKALAPLQDYLKNNLFASKRSRSATQSAQEPVTRRASLKDGDV